MKAQQPRSQRRTVLATLAAGGAVAAVAVASRLGGKAPASSLPDEARVKEPASTGYRETAHVRKYYRTAA